MPPRCPLAHLHVPIVREWCAPSPRAAVRGARRSRRRAVGAAGRCLAALGPRPRAPAGSAASRVAARGPRRRPRALSVFFPFHCLSPFHTVKALSFWRVPSCALRHLCPFVPLCPLRPCKVFTSRRARSAPRALRSHLRTQTARGRVVTRSGMPPLPPQKKPNRDSSKLCPPR
jgi:hypothetical protein